ncbi:ABC transporter permease [Enterococcus sp. LJL120]
MMGEFFSVRLGRHQKRMLRYLRYVFNDHFTIVLLFLLGGLSLYYSQILGSVPQGSWLVSVFVGILWLASLHFGSLATLAQEADMVFLLPKERALKSYFVRSLRYSCILPFVVLIFISGFTMPLLVISTQRGLSNFIWYLIALWLLKICQLILQYYRLFQHDQRTNFNVNLIWLTLSLISIFLGIFVAPWLAVICAGLGVMAFWHLYFSRNLEPLDWEKMVLTEKNRVHRIYQFINLFTDVPEITGTVKRRKYLDPILNKISKTHGNTYIYLYARRMMRGSEFSGLYLRLVVIGSILLAFLDDFYFSTGVAMLFIYLIGFQMIPLYNQFKYMILTHLYPVSKKQQQSALEKLIFGLLLFAAIVFGGINFIVLGISLDSLLAFVLLLAEVLLFVKFYIPSRIKKMQD